MAEKAPPKRRSAAAVKQEMQATLAEAQKDVAERREAAATPEQRLEERNVARAVEADITRQKEELAREMESTRTQWDAEKSEREADAKDADAAEKKRREREKEEYRYAFAREQQLAKDQFADEKGKIERELAEKKLA